ncbi:sensor histidine kinase [Acinetobacter chinensis]|jgi:signal transduction histidine kinase|uniref:sensor histidine kinase n=1 Tax=Acinetobacter chinensis TaxID=2004650 RepID=UPI00293435FE|nr:ATP-binding protein [Acinetobacter chinensis]WOE42934.1 7TM diverse intracellular signaling domain-containing protein [Acinetobacter chinensis]
MRFVCAVLFYFFTGIYSSVFAQQFPVNEQCRVNVHAMEAVRTDSMQHVPASGWEKVSLPDTWSERWHNYNGAVWYRIKWDWHCDHDAHLQEPVVFSVKSINSAGAVFLNGDLLWSDKNLSGSLSRSWNMPRYWILPIAGLNQGKNEVLIFIKGYAFQLPGLGAVGFNNVQKNYEIHKDRVWNQRTMFLISIIMSATLGVFCFVIWLFRREDQTFALFALSSLFWILFISSVLRTETLPLMTTLQDAQFTMIVLVCYICSFCLYLMRFIDKKFPRIEISIAVLTGISILGLLFTDMNNTASFHSLIFLCYLVLLLLCILYVFYITIRTRKLEYILLSLAMLVILIIGCVDLGILTLNHFKNLPPLVPYTSSVITLFIVVVLSMRLTRSIKRIELFNHELEVKIQHVSDDLKSSLMEKHGLELKNVRLQERIHLSHDLHDVLGASIVRSMIMVDQSKENFSNQHFLSMLKLLRDDLRQIIDSGSSAGVAVPENPLLWIAPVRHRFSQLMDEMDINSSWSLPSQWKIQPTALQCLTLIRVLEESLTNIVKHSYATEVKVVMDIPDSTQIVLIVVDNGVGFDVDCVLKQGMSVGMRSMQLRLEKIGASLQMSSQAGRTVICAIMPVRL